MSALSWMAFRRCSMASRSSCSAARSSAHLSRSSKARRESFAPPLLSRIASKRKNSSTRLFLSTDIINFSFQTSLMMLSFSSRLRTIFSRSLSASARNSSASLRLNCLMWASLFCTCSSRFRASCCALWFSMACTSAAERSCIFRRCFAASFSRPMPRSCSSFCCIRRRIACASFWRMRTSSCAWVLFLASSFSLCAWALDCCCFLMVSNFASRAWRSSSVFCNRCMALSCSSCRFAKSSEMNFFRAASLRTRPRWSFSSSCVSSSCNNFARVNASTLPVPATVGATPCCFGCWTSSSCSSSSGVGSAARHNTFKPL
mmetsp:Transcript_41132/g.116362  ORF Transcript_41132/g.116362 Transcript_41132/m.116362 type:complete len:317 (-) Transcript_41132:364-1314(-)